MFNHPVHSSFMTRKLRFFWHAALPIFCLAPSFAQNPEQPPDPTKSSPRMKAALMAGGSAIPAMTVKGLVVGSTRSGGAVVFDISGNHVLARVGVPFMVIADGEARKLTIRSISADGIEIEAPALNETAIIPSFGPIANQSSGQPGDISYAQFRELPLLDALQMLSDQTGLNFSSSAEANKILVNAMLRNVPATSVVEELCKSYGLWFKRDERTGITRIMTVGEFEKDLVSYHEEQTEVFTLKYPNVNEVAYAIADLYGDRVQFNPGAEDSDNDMIQDLGGRFDRFDLLNQRTQTAENLNTNTNGNSSGSTVGNSANGFYSNGNNFSSFGGSYGNSRYGSRYNNNNSNRSPNFRTNQNLQGDDQSLRNLTPEQAQRVERALAGSGDSSEVEAMRKRPATIFVTSSRRNNQVVVRTSDAGALDAIRKLVTRMDVPTPLVLLEVKVVSIELGKEFRSSFDYQFSNNTIGAAFSRGAIDRPNPAGEFSGAQLPLGDSVLGGAGFNSGDMTFVVVSDNFRARMQLFESKNRVKTLSTPILLTANNEVSRIFLGEQRPIVTGISSQTILTDNNAATTPNTTTELRNVGTTLLITPNINSDRTVTLRLVQDNSTISPNAANIPIVTNTNQSGVLGNLTNRTTGVQNVPVDVVASRTVSGTFVAKDGMAIAIGGLIENDNIDKREQVPLLGNIPVLGFFFRRTDREKSRHELVIMIRPYVMSTPADGERVSRDLLDRLAPTSVERLVDEGFLPDLPPPPVPKVVKRPPPSAAATKKIEPTPTPMLLRKSYK